MGLTLYALVSMVFGALGAFLFMVGTYVASRRQRRRQAEAFVARIMQDQP